MKWFLAIVALIGAALALQAGLVAFAGYVLLGVYLLSRYLARRWVHDLAATRACAADPREIGETTEVSVNLENTGPLPIAWVLVEDLVPDFAVKARTPRLTIKGKRVHVVSLRPKGTKTLKYKVTFAMRGYYPLGPTLLETGDVFGLHRRHRVVGKPVYVMVYPRVVPLPKYNFASERPIGEIRLQNRLFEDPTRTAGVRQYVLGDPLQRVHWKVTARTGQLHCRIYEPTTLAGATILVDFHQAGYHKRGEPFRSELAVTTAVSIAYLISVLNVQVGFASNGRDAADRIREESLADESPDALVEGHATRAEARGRFELNEDSDRIRPVVVETRRGFDQFQQIREALARLELSDALTFGQLTLELAGRMPRDATVIAILPHVSPETAIALGTLKRQGFAVSAILIGLDENHKLEAHGRLLAETIRDVRYVNSEEELAHLGENTAAHTPAAYAVDIPLT
ncbi:MAG: DUF58 domain-containing protein [Gemmataceae bacterium]|nr:DUF58 domain-containing protein [Gemmataceae bacterium]